MAADLRALRDYVTAAPSGIQSRGDGTVLLQVTHSNLKAVFMELRFDMHMTVARVKDKLVSHVGTNASAMTLSLRSPQGQTLYARLEDERMLGFYSPEDGCVLHVADADPFSLSRGGGLEDLSQVEKYTMSDADYDKRENTYRKFKQKKLEEDPNWSFYGEIAKRTGQQQMAGAGATKEKAGDEHMGAEAEEIKVGQRCEVSPGGRRGVVRFVGKAGDVEGGAGVLPAGWWVGVEYDEPLGKHDGSVKGARFFTCAENFGAMVRPDKVVTGDFPPIADELFDSDDEL